MPPSPHQGRTRSGRDEEALLTRLRPVLAPAAFLAGWTFLGGAVGMVAGALLAAVSWRILGAAEAPAVRRRRELLARQLPVGVQLLAAALRAGTDLQSAMATVAEALPGPFGEELARIGRELTLGVPPEQVWMGNADDPVLGPMARTLGRAQETGAAVAGVMEDLAVELQGRRRAETERAARSVDVRASAPLGLCFLPAFMMLGVLPLVAGVFESLSLLK